MLYMRCFIGIPIPENICQELERKTQELRDRNPTTSLALQPPANFHITVLFLGEIPDESVPEIVSTLGRLKNKVIRVSTGPIRSFTHDDKTSIFVSIHGADELHDLHNEATRLFGSPVTGKENNPYIPHITLARMKGETSPLVMPNLLQFTWEARTLILYKSTHTPRGSQYTPLNTTPLQ
jgi:2'-5' RNA ligase